MRRKLRLPLHKLFWCCPLLLVLVLAGCGSVPMTAPPETAGAPPAPVLPNYPDHALLKDALQGKTLTLKEKAELSDRLLVEGASTFKDGETMARLELLLLKALKEDDRQQRHRFLRNLGIIHYHQKHYKRARQELQASNELYPRDARTHYYLARLWAIEGAKYDRKGQKKKSRGQLKLAVTELALARKLEPTNPLYQQGVSQLLRQNP